MLFNKTENFKKRIIGVHGDKGRDWLGHLPEILNQAEKVFDIHIKDPFELSYNYVTKAVKKETNDELVLKVGVPDKEFVNEIRTLEKFDGSGFVKLVDKDVELSAFLMNYIQGNNPPLDIIDATTNCMKNIPDITTEIGNFPEAGDWFKALTKYREKNSGPLDMDYIIQAEDMSRQLLYSEQERVLLHGDLHGGNILFDGKNYIAIDPKGIIGEKALEPAQFFLNAPLEVLEDRSVVEQWLKTLEQNNHLDRDRVMAYAFCKAVLSLVWFVEDNDPSWEEGMAYAKILKKYI